MRRPSISTTSRQTSAYSSSGASLASFTTQQSCVAETSSTGQTIAVPQSLPNQRDTDGPPTDDEAVYRLDAETIFTDGLETRNSTMFELYTPEKLRRRQAANHNPGPQVGTDTVNDEWDLPPATHLPARPNENSN